MTRFSTDSIHGHDYYDIETGAFKVPVYLSTIFEHPDRRTGEARKSDRGFEQKYSREENPTVRAFEKVIAKLEKALPGARLQQWDGEHRGRVPLCAERGGQHNHH